MKIIGLTGGISSGKSTAADYFAQLGAIVIDADNIARELVEKGMPALAQIKTQFGEHILDKDGSLNRSKMRDLVFSSPVSNANREKLEAILHPLIYNKIAYQIALLKEKHPLVSYCVVVIPLLIEKASRFASLVDTTMVIDIPENLQVSRLKLRAHLSTEQALAIIRTQASREARLLKADIVLSNTGDLKALKEQIHRLHRLWHQT